MLSLLLVVVVIGLLLIPTGAYFEMAWLTYSGIALIFICALSTIVYANTGNRKNTNSEASVVGGNGATQSVVVKAVTTSVIVFFGLALVATGILFYQGEKDPVVNIVDGSIQIKAIYGVNIGFPEITEISLIEENMSVIGINNSNRISGYCGISGSLKGRFKSGGLGEALVFVQSNSVPVIRIERQNSEDVYISFRDSEKTKQLYREMTDSGLDDK